MCEKKKIIFHAGKEIVKVPEIRKTKYTKDFSWGFYCTLNYNQAVRWANRGDGGEPVINYFDYVENPKLNILTFKEMSNDWLDFIANCRSGNHHSYDIVEGPMADDTVWNFVNDFIYGDITREQFWSLAKFKYPTHQISFHTQEALSCLGFVKSEVVYDKK